MDETAIADLIRDAIPDAEVEVTTPRHPDDDDHYAAVVVSPAFERLSLVDQHQLVYDAIDEHLTTDIHAIEIETYTPDEAPDQD